jgi:hypothetical protein
VPGAQNFADCFAGLPLQHGRAEPISPGVLCIERWKRTAINDQSGDDGPIRWTYQPGNGRPPGKVAGRLLGITGRNGCVQPHSRFDVPSPLLNATNRVGGGPFTVHIPQYVRCASDFPIMVVPPRSCSSKSPRPILR